MDFSATFQLVLMFDFMDAFLVRVVAAQRRVYLIEEHGLDISASFLLL